MTANQAIKIVESLSSSGVRTWVMGGWGVDALLGRQTRTHHDLDLLVSASDLPALGAWLERHAFCRAYVWEENAPARVDGAMWDTAFVEQHDDGRELDVHAVAIGEDRVRLATTDPWELPPRPLEGAGRINGRAAACVTADAQYAMHRGYELPDKHREDLRRLRSVPGHSPDRRAIRHSRIRGRTTGG